MPRSTIGERSASCCIWLDGWVMKELTKKPHGSSRPNLITTLNLSETSMHLIQASLLHLPPDDFPFLSRIDHTQNHKDNKNKITQRKTSIKPKTKTVNSYVLFPITIIIPMPNTLPNPPRSTPSHLPTSKIPPPPLLQIFPIPPIP
jgi:hypothetical protein